MYSKCSLAQVAHLILSPTLESAMFDVLLNISGAYIHAQGEEETKSRTEKTADRDQESYRETAERGRYTKRDRLTKRLTDKEMREFF